MLAIDEWHAVLEDPANKDNFVIAYRSKNFEDCAPVCDSLNNLMQKHMKNCLDNYIRDMINESGDE